MKKFVVLSFVSLLILAFGSIVYGQEKAPVLEFKASGFIDVLSLWYVNATAGGTTGPAGLYDALPTDYKYGGPPNFVRGKALDKKTAYMESRARLRFDTVIDKNLSGTIILEMDSAQWGDTNTTNAQRNIMGYWSADRAAVEIKNVYIDFGVPGIPVPITMRVGLQPLGFRPNILMTTDGMAISAGIKIDPVFIAPFWAKALENAVQTADDVDVYGLRVEAAVGTVKVGGYGLYFNMNTYPLAAGAAANTADMWWLGFYTDGKLGPVNLNFDFIHDNGKVKAHNRGVVPDVKYSGWATYLKADYPWEKFNFGVVGMYASGADQERTSSTGLPGSVTPYGSLSKEVSSYVVPPGSEAGTNFGESVVFYSSWITRGDSGIASNNNPTAAGRGPIGGTWMAKLYGSYKAIPDWKVTLQALYIGDTTKHGNTFGSAVTADQLPRDNNDIGFELDLINEFQIYKNLKYTVGAGYLWAGKALDLRAGLNFNDSPKNPWNICTNLTYAF